MVGHNPQFTYRKDGVVYFSRRIPKDIRRWYEHDKFVMCLRTKSRVSAGNANMDGSILCCRHTNRGTLGKEDWPYDKGFV